MILSVKGKFAKLAVAGKFLKGFPSQPEVRTLAMFAAMDVAADYHLGNDMSSLNLHMHPGGVLEELYLKPLGLSAIALAKRLDIPRRRIERLVTEMTSMTPDTALRLAHFLKLRLNTG